MKKKDILLIIALILLSLGLFIFNITSSPTKKTYLVIKVEKKIYGRYSLDKNQTIKINKTNTCQIKEGKVTMIEAHCPDKICLHSMPIDKHGGNIICLPNQVFLEIENGDESVDATTN